MIFEFIIILCFAVVISRGKETEGPRYVGCALKQIDWITYDYLLINWTIPQSLLNRTSQVFVEWNMEENYGSCGEVTNTSCIMYWNKSGTVDFNSDFNLTVSIVAADEETLSVSHWWIHAKSCLGQPPKLANLSAIPLNSSCIDAKWSFSNDKSNDQGCSNYFSKTYRVRYKEYQHSNSTWSILKVMPQNGDTCQGSKVICGLVPYTLYKIGVECRNSKHGTEYGVWSDVTIAKVKTEEDVPSAAPEVTPGSFSYPRKDCDVSSTRIVDFYWKNISEEFRNGILKGIEVEIYETNMKTPVQKVNVTGEDPVSSIAVLACSTSYIVSLKAFTVVGFSNMESSLIIPKDDSVLDIVADIVPTVSETDDVMVDWIFHRNITFNVTGYTVFWCGKTLDGTCTSDFNWAEVPSHKKHYVLQGASSLPAHKYVFGVSVQSHNQSSGVLWSRCLYAEDIDIQPPSNIRLIDDKVDGTLHVQWDTLSCDDPYILQYLAYICVLDSDKKNCSGEILRREMAGSQTSVRFTDLDPSNFYRIYIVAATRSNITSTRSIEGQPYKEGTGLTVAHKAGIIIGGLVALALVIMGIVAISRHIHKRCCSVTDIPDILEQQVEFLPSEDTVVRQNGNALAIASCGSLHR